MSSVEGSGSGEGEEGEGGGEEGSSSDGGEEHLLDSLGASDEGGGANGRGLCVYAPDSLMELPRAQESEGDPDYYALGLPGTTPPQHGRLAKMSKKTHKHKPIKRMAYYGPISGKRKESSKKRPQSMVMSSTPDSAPMGFSPSRRHTIPEIFSAGVKGHQGLKVKGEKGHKKRVKSPTSGYASPASDEVTRRKKKNDTRKRQMDRDEKFQKERLNPSPQLLLPPAPLLQDIQKSISQDMSDFSLSPQNSLDFDSIQLTESLQPLQSRRRVSDRSRRMVLERQHSLSLSTGGSGERHYCPPDRNRFYRNFVKALKYSGIAATRNRPESSTGPSTVHHIARLRSENLALQNPYGQLWEQIWLELQACLRGTSSEAHKEWMFYHWQAFDEVLTRVTNFQMPQFDPQMSLNQMFFAAEDSTAAVPSREDYEPLSLTSEQISAASRQQEAEEEEELSEERDEDITVKAERSIEAQASVLSNQDSVDSKSSSGSASTTDPSVFLSSFQLSALEKVSTLLGQLDRVESVYPNRRRIGDEHPNYRSLSFKRKARALLLWHKVTTFLALKLATLSKWLGVEVTCPDVCSDPIDSDELEHGLTSSLAKQVSFSNGVLSSSPTKTQAQLTGSPPQDDLVQSLTSSSLKRLISVTRTGSTASSSIPTLPRLFSNYQLVLEQNRGPYRPFVDRWLKTKGLSLLLPALRDYLAPVLRLAHFALTPPSAQGGDDPEGEGDNEHTPLLRHYLPPSLTSPTHTSTAPYDRSTSVGPENWLQEFCVMGLPLFSSQYLRLVHMPLDVMHECLKLQLELRPPYQPSLHSVKQLVKECRETLEQAIQVRDFYRDNVEVVTNGNQPKLEQVETDLEKFDSDLKNVFEVYFDYLQSWVQQSSGYVLEDEWRHVKHICSRIRGGESEAGRRFCDMASELLESTGDILSSRMDECCHSLHSSRKPEEDEDRRVDFGESCRNFKELFVDMKERSSKALGFAKMLKKDLEVAADFSVDVPTAEMLRILQASDHVCVQVIPHRRGKMLFVPEQTADSTEDIQQLLSVSFAHDQPHATFDLNETYLLLMNTDGTDSHSAWNGRTVAIQTSVETTIAIADVQVEGLKMVVKSSASLASCRHSLLSAVGSAVTLTCEQTSSHENVTERIADLKMAACGLARKLMDIILPVTEHLSMEESSSAGEELKTPYQGTLLACFNLGFEYVREVFRLLGDEMAYQQLGSEVLEFAEHWMRFVVLKCDRGRGTRPRWATAGLDFLALACAPRTLAIISSPRFEALKKLMNRSLDHVIGEATPTSSAAKIVLPSRPNHTPYRKPWKQLPLGVRGFSCDRVEEEAMAPLGRREGVRLGRVVMDGNVVHVSHSHGDLYRLPAHETTPTRPQAPPPRLYGGDPLFHEPQVVKFEIPDSALFPEVSPPISTGSCDSAVEQSSSGHDSPLALSGDVTHTASSYAPISNPRHTLPTPPQALERTDSSASGASLGVWYSPYVRSPSLASSTSSSSVGGACGGEGGATVSARTHTIQESIRLMERNRDEKLMKDRVIGHVTERHQSSLHELAKLSNLKQTHYKWQRGRKLGEGKFGKVFECRNMDTGEINAVKQISIQEKDASAVQTIISEISCFQRLSHPNIVKFFGVEVHHSELYMFMEYCNEGTIWSIAQQGLDEHMVRHYTRDIVKAVYFLHESGVVHRDIKGSNIFLSSNDSIKLGDFGLSVQLKNYQKTLPNEIKQQVGTVPYMSPEVVLKHEMGRPMDIWSLGCVVVEMATGKIPWPEFDNAFQIMYQLGVGKAPPVPEDALSSEGKDFIACCFQHSPAERWKAGRLLDHRFVKVSDCSTGD